MDWLWNLFDLITSWFRRRKAPVPKKLKVTLTSFLVAAVLTMSSVSASAQAIGLSWKDNANNESGFEVQRKLGSTGTWTSLTELAGNAVTYVDSGLQYGILYCYRVRAFNTAGNSGFSNEACASIVQPPQPAPTSPTELKVTIQ